VNGLNGAKIMKGLFKKLALAAPLAVCLPLCAQAGDPAVSADEPAGKIFEDYSLTSATDNGDQKVLSTSASLTAPTPPAPNQPAPIPGSAPGCTSGNLGSGCTGNLGGGCPAPPNCCNTYGESFCEPCCVFNAGVEATIFHVQTRGMLVDSFITREADGTSFETGNSQVFDQIAFSPRIWAGVQEDCYGIEGRFWYLSDSTNRLTPWETFPAFMTGQYTMDRIKAYTVDLEGTYSTCYCGNKLTGFLGARYASYEAGQGIDLTRDTTPTEVFNTSAFSKFTFNGAGITVGFTGRTPLTCDGCVNAVYGVRGSVLWGESERAVQTQATDVEAGGAATSTNSAFSDNWDTAFIVEALAGVEWDHELKCLPMCAFLRVAVEYQYWNLGNKGSVSSDSFAVSNTGFANSNASIGTVENNLIGFTVATGFTW
jgi:hypothetical protein